VSQVNKNMPALNPEGKENNKWRSIPQLVRLLIQNQLQLYDFSAEKQSILMALVPDN
jgi:hypothetical protein